jgi:putative transport protein
MIDAFKDNPLLLLFMVSAIGYWVGTITIRGTRLGVAAVLFVGLGFGALDPGLKVPDIVIVLGLSMFVYTIGLSSGPGFFSTFQRRGFRDVYFILVMLIFSASVTAGLHIAFGFDAATSAGLLAGSSTNTPSLAGLLDLIDQSQAPELREGMGNQAVVGYSLAYPMGVIGAMLALYLMQKLFRIDYKKEAEDLQELYPNSELITRFSVEVNREEVAGSTLRDWFQRFKGQLVFGRMERGQNAFLPNMDTELQLGDKLVLVGNKSALEEAAEAMGGKLDTEVTYDRTIYDVRRFFVTNASISGQKIASLNLPEKFSVIITRVQRGDMDMIATGDTVLELGDRVVLVTPRKDIQKLSSFFGNSYEALSHINLLSFGSGMALGLLLGMVTFTLPGDFNFKLGFAGGPIIVALILGALRRTGPIVWTLPYSANLTLRQIGLILMLAGIGIRSGHTFLQTILEGGGGMLFLSGAIIAITTALLSFFVGYKLLKIPFSLLSGMVSIQPAVLDYALDQTKNKLPTIGFTLILPVALIAKIIIVQILFVILNG